MERGRLRRTTTALIIGFSTAWLSVALIGCGGGGSSSDPGGGSPSQAPIPIGAAGGQVSSADGQATLTVPPNAVATDTIFSINQAIGAPSSSRIVGAVYDVEPTGTTFSSDNPARLTLAYNALPFGTDISTLRLGTVVNGTWGIVTDSATDTVIDAANQTVTAPLTHLSMYAVLQPAATPAPTTPPTNHPPTASAGVTYVGAVNQELTLYATGSIDPDGDALTYTWTFGDASAPSTTTSQTVTHTYSSPNVYTATLTVTDTHGASAQATARITINPEPSPGNQPPIANAGGPYHGTAGQAVAFDGSSSSDPDGDPLTYGWDFGDQTAGTGVTPAHAYGTEGTFHVTLTVSDGRGGTSPTTVDAVIAAAPPVNRAPTAVIKGGPYNGTVDQTLTLSAEGSFDPDHDLLTYTWTFGDVLPSSTTTSQTITHTYRDIGDYTAGLTVDDGHGLTATATTQVKITQAIPSNQPPIANAGGPYAGTAGQPVAFDGSGSYDRDGTIVSYIWDFGDGNAGSGVTPSHAYGIKDTYHVTLTVTDNLGAASTATVDAQITPATQINHPPTASITMPSTGLVGQLLTFTGIGNDQDGDILTFSWDFGDGSAASPTNPATHTYKTAETFTVRLTVDDGHLGTFTASGLIVVTAPPPTAVSQQYTIPLRDAGGVGLYRSQYAITLNGSGVAPLTFRIVTFPTNQDPLNSMDMSQGTWYQWWNPVTSSWRPECRNGDPSCQATTSSHVDLTPDLVTGLPKGDVTVTQTTGTVTVTLSDAPVTVIYTPQFCYSWAGLLANGDSFTFIVTDATGATSAPATISIALADGTCSGHLL
ncbi:MAG: PKD domain-containing protein [Nitrospirae bacterium]|nr:PKD domain-containing protein [Nitrospirota bacterium]